MTKIRTLAATGLVGLVLGAGVGVAAAGQDDPGPMRDRPGDVTSMDEMHATMTDQMPAELAEQCDEMHATMGEHMGDGDHASMMGSMGSMADGMGTDMTDRHARHHAGTEG